MNVFTSEEVLVDEKIGTETFVPELNLTAAADGLTEAGNPSYTFLPTSTSSDAKTYTFGANARYNIYLDNSEHFTLSGDVDGSQLDLEVGMQAITITIAPKGTNTSGEDYVAYLYVRLLEDTNGLSPLIVTQYGTAPIAGGGDVNKILYFDGTGDNAMLKAGKWGTEVTASNIAFFKGGSVIAFRPISSAESTAANSNPSLWNSDYIKFNPMSDASSIVSFPTVPAYAKADYDAGILNVSSSKYHNLANIQKGKGDPCKLVGLTAGEIKAGNITSSAGLRLPMPAENIEMVWGSVPEGMRADVNHKFHVTSTTTGPMGTVYAAMPSPKYDLVKFPLGPDSSTYSDENIGGVLPLLGAVTGTNSFHGSSNRMIALWSSRTSRLFADSSDACIWKVAFDKANPGQYAWLPTGGMIVNVSMGWYTSAIVRCVPE